VQWEQKFYSVKPLLSAGKMEAVDRMKKKKTEAVSVHLS